VPQFNRGKDGWSLSPNPEDFAEYKGIGTVNSNASARSNRSRHLRHKAAPDQLRVTARHTELVSAENPHLKAVRETNHRMVSLIKPGKLDSGCRNAGKLAAVGRPKNDVGTHANLPPAASYLPPGSKESNTAWKDSGKRVRFNNNTTARVLRNRMHDCRNEKAERTQNSLLKLSWFGRSEGTWPARRLIKGAFGCWLLY